MKLIIRLTAILAMLTLTACGGGGGGDSSPSGGNGEPGPAPISGSLAGTGAVGHAIANQTLTVVDATGKTYTTTTNAMGKFTLDVDIGSSPYMLKLETGAEPLYSFTSAVGGNINITPLTTLAVYEANKTGSTYAPLAALFDSFGSSSGDVTVIELAAAVAIINTILEDKLTEYGLTTSYNFFDTPFEVNLMGIDGVLDDVDITYGPGTTAGDVTITITGNFANGGQPYDPDFVANQPSALTTTITAAASPIDADGSSTSVITVQVKTLAGADVTSGSFAVGLTLDLSTPSLATISGVSGDNGTYTATLMAGSALVAGTATVNGTLDGNPISVPAVVALSSSVPSHLTSTIDVSPAAIPADGSSTSNITVQLKDAGGTNLTTGGNTVTLSATGLGTLSGTVIDNSNGTYSEVLTAGVASGPVTITGTVDGSANFSDNAVVALTSSTPNGAMSTISANPVSISANGSATSAVTVQLKDASGTNLTAGGNTVLLNTTLGSLSGSVTDNGDGTYSELLTAGVVPGTATITGTVDTNNITGGSAATVAITAPTPSAATSTIVASPTSIAADGSATSTITVQLKDASGTNITTDAAVIVINATTVGSSSIGTTSYTSNGAYTATLTAGVSAGSVTVSATLDGGNITSGNETVALTSSVPSAAMSTISASPTSITGDGSATSTITVQLKDAGGTNITSDSATIVISATALGTVGATSYAGGGTYTATLTAGSTAGSVTVSATLDGGSITSGDATVTLTTSGGGTLGDGLALTGSGTATIGSTFDDIDGSRSATVNLATFDWAYGVGVIRSLQVLEVRSSAIGTVGSGAVEIEFNNSGPITRWRAVDMADLANLGVTIDTIARTVSFSNVTLPGDGNATTLILNGVMGY